MEPEIRGPPKTNRPVANVRGSGGASRKGSVTASFGSLFVFDTCKPSDLKNALDELEQDESFADEKGEGVASSMNFGPYSDQGGSNGVSSASFGTQSINSFEFGTFDTYISLNKDHQAESSFDALDKQDADGTPSSIGLSGDFTSKSVGEVDEFAYADEQLDAMIDMLDLSVLMEDDRGMTDWMDDEALASFEFAPEWLEMTITMKTTRDGKQEAPSPSQADSGFGSGSLGANQPSQPLDEVEALFASKRREAAEAATHLALSNSTSRFSPSSSPPGSIIVSGSRSNPSSVKIPLNRSSPTTSSQTPPSSSPPGSVSTSPSETQTSSRKLTQLQRSISHQVTTVTTPVTLGTPHSTASAPLSGPPVQALPLIPLQQQPLFPQRPIPPTGALPPTPLVPVSTASPPSSFILPKAFVAPKVANTKGSPSQSPIGPLSPLSQSPSPFPTPLGQQLDSPFQQPLLVSPGLGETTMTIGAAVYRMNRMMDPSAPFESILHDTGALHPSPLVTVSAPTAIPPSAGTNQQSPPSFTVNVVVIAHSSDAIEALCGIGHSAAQFLQSSNLQVANSSITLGSDSASSPSSSPSARPLPTGAPLVMSKAKGVGSSATSSQVSSLTPVELQMSQAINYPNIPGKFSSQAPHVLVATLAILNPQGRTKRVVKLIAIAMAPSDSVPSIPTTATTNGELRRPTPFQGDLTTLSLVSAISSSNGAIFMLPSPYVSSQERRAGSIGEFDALQSVENLSNTLKVFQRLNYHSGPIKGNPHVRLLTFPKEYGAQNAGYTGTASSSGSQTDYIFESAISWAKAQSIGMMKVKKIEVWEQEWKEKVGPSGASAQWFLNPIIAHVSAQTHVLRMEALMSSFDRSLQLDREAKIKSGGTSAPSTPNLGSGVGAPQGGIKTPAMQRQTVGSDSTTSTAVLSPQGNKPIIMGLPIGVAPPAPLPSVSSPSSATKANSSLSSSNKIKRTVAVIGLPGSGRSSVIKRACHARTSKLLPGESSMMSTVMMSTLSPMTGTLMGGSSGAGGQVLTSSFADVYFNTSRCLMEFVETPVRALNKIQFYKDINRAHAFIFVYNGVHPSPQDIQDIHASLQDILAAKAQANEMKRVSPLGSPSTFGTGPRQAPPSSSRRSSTFTLNEIPIIIIGTQAPVNPEMSLANLLKAMAGLGAFDASPEPAADPSMMTLAQLLQTHRLAHFSVDTAPLHNSELGKALQWLYNRIGEDTLQLKGIRATNRPHHSGSISVVRPTPTSTASGGPAKGVLPPQRIPPSSTPSSPNVSTLGLNSSSPQSGATKIAAGVGGSALATSTPITTASNSQRNMRASVAPSQDSNSSVALFRKIEMLVMRMRGAPGSGSQSWALPIADRRLENGQWTTIPNSNTSSGGSSSSQYASSEQRGSSSYYDEESISSSSKKKILIKCFSGSEAVDWTVEHIVKPEKAVNSGASTSFAGASGSYVTSPSQLRSEALSHLQQLMDVSVIRCVYGGSDNAKFLDSQDALYRFQMDEDNESILNTRKVWIGDVDHVEIEQLASWLFQKIQPFIVPSDGNGNPTSSAQVGLSGVNGNASTIASLSNGSIVSSSSNPSLASTGDYGSMSGSKPFVIDGESFKATELFNELLLFSAKLQKVSLKKLNHAQKVAFWINVYNILSIHANIQHGHAGKSKTKRKFLYNKTFYQIDGLVYSLDDILHGILRGNRKNPNTSKYPFKPADPRRKNVLHSDVTSNLNANLYGTGSTGGLASTSGSSFPLPLDPRIHFALTTLTKSSPFIMAMKWDILDAQLDALAKQLLATDLEVNFKNSVVVLPPCIHNFRTDFSKAAQPLLSFLSRFLDSEKSKNVAFLANKIKDKDIKSKSDDTTPSAPRIRTSA